MTQAANGTGNENSQPAAEPERVVEVAEDSNGSTGPTEKKISTKEPPKTAAMRKSQKAKQKENIEQKMLALLSEDRDRGGWDRACICFYCKKGKGGIDPEIKIQIYRCCQCIIC